MNNADFDFGRLIRLHKLFSDTYLAEFEHCLAIVKVNKDGEIVRLTRFGNR